MTRRLQRQRGCLCWKIVVLCFFKLCVWEGFLVYFVWDLIDKNTPFKDVHCYVFIYKYDIEGMKIKQIDTSITPHIVTFCVGHVLRANKTLGLSKFQENHPILLIMVNHSILLIMVTSLYYRSLYFIPSIISMKSSDLLVCYLSLWLVGVFSLSNWENMIFGVKYHRIF